MLEALRGHGHEPRPSGDGWTCRCPAHDDHNPSLSIDTGDDGRALLKCHAGCATKAIVAALGLKEADLFPAPTKARARRRRKDAEADRPAGVIYPTARDAIAALDRDHGEHSARWLYFDSAGEPEGVVVRWDLSDGKKDIRPVSRLGSGGWAVRAMRQPRPLYLLPQLAAGNTDALVIVTEGEKCADAAAALGFQATTSAGGANAAAKSDWTPLHGRRVAILPDADDAGEKYAADVLRLARIAGAAEVKIIRLPDLPAGGDLVDFLAVHDAEEMRATIERMIDAAPAETAPDGATIDGEGTPVLVCLADVEPKPIEWLWPRRIPRGVLAQIPGNPDVGKTTLALDLAARISTGRRWPDTPESAPLGSVLILTAEDLLAETIVPRLKAAGADLGSAHVLRGIRTADGEERMIDFETDCATLEGAITRTPDCRLVIVDPLTAYLGDRDNYNAAKVRPLLSRLARIAETHGVTILTIEHFRKGAGPAIHKPGGSVAFIAAARVSYCCCRDPDDESGTRRLFLPVKANLAPPIGGLAYRLRAVPEWNTCAVEWESGAVSMTADDALRDRLEGAGGGKLEGAKDLLLDLLADGPRTVADLKREAKDAGQSWRTVERAKEEMKIKARKDGMAGGWVWTLPGEDGQPADGSDEDRHSPNRGGLRSMSGDSACVSSKAAKSGALAAFSEPDADPADFEERAAIREYGGGLSRAEAERLTQEEIR